MKRELLVQIRCQLGKSVRDIVRIICKAATWPNNNSALVVAVATCALVVVTWLNIREAGKMRGETKRLVDITIEQLKEAREMRIQTEKMADSSVRQAKQAERMADNSSRQTLETKRMIDSQIEQFRIKSYPAFLVSAEEVSVDSAMITEKFSFWNRGQIVALQTSVLAMNAYQKPPSLPFIDVFNDVLYEYAGKKSVGEVEINLPPTSGYNITIKNHFPPTESIETLKTVLLLVRFKIPHDRKYSYETHAFVLNGDHKTLSIVNSGDVTKLIQTQRTAGWPHVAPQQKPIVEKFLIDY